MDTKNTDPPELFADPSPDYWTTAVTLGRLEGKLDQLLASQQLVKEITDDHELRLRTLEKSQWKRLGFVSAIGSLCGAVGTSLAIKAGVLPQ